MMVYEICVLSINVSAQLRLYRFKIYLSLSLSPSLGVTRHGVVLTDLQSLVDCQ